MDLSNNVLTTSEPKSTILNELNIKNLESTSIDIDKTYFTAESENENIKEKEPLTKKKFCLICGQVSHGFHFGILACRACAAFFRRTIVEKKKYKCRQDVNCEIVKEMRNMCRACRYKKCENFGMNKDDVQLNRDIIGKRKKHTKLKRLPSTELITDNADFNPNVKATTLAYFENKSKLNEKYLTTEITSLENPSKILLNKTEIVDNTNQSQIYKTERDILHTTGSSPLTTTVILMPQPIKQNFNTMPTSIATSTFAFLPYSVSTNNNLTPNIQPSFPMLNRMLNGFSSFTSSQKTLFTVMYPDNIFSNETYRLIKHNEYVKMERGCLSLMYSMINDWFQPFNSLPHEFKISVLRLFSDRFSLLDQSYRTMKVFPNSKDSRYAVHYGQYIDLNYLDQFFSDDKEFDVQMLSKYTINIVRISRRIISRLQQISVREIEIVALVGIILWNDVANFDAKIADTTCNQIYAELHNNMIHTYGAEGTGARLGSLLSTLHDLNLLEKEHNETATIQRLLNPNAFQVWDDL